MKKTSRCLAMVLAGVLLLVPQVWAVLVAKDASLAVTPIQKEESVSSFWEKFKSAVIGGDKAKVVSLSRFPIARGYGMSSIRSKAQFMRRYRELFFVETDAAQCFPKAKPVVDRDRPNEFSVSCPFAKDSSGEEPFVYTFTHTRTGWKFTSFENINE